MKRMPIVAISTGLFAICALLFCAPFAMNDCDTLDEAIARLVLAIGVTGFGFWFGLTLEQLFADDPPAKH
ncbi:MAG TPA: hypothetical protein VGJ26_10230 [Pirellulales bacterium]